MTILATPLGLLIAGPVSGLFGVTIWFLVAGSIMILLGGICLAMPSIRGVDDLLMTRQKQGKGQDWPRSRAFRLFPRKETRLTAHLRNA